MIGIVTDAKVTYKRQFKGSRKSWSKKYCDCFGILAKPQDQLIIPDVHPLLSALVSIVPGQLLAYYATLQKSYDVDKPRNLAKSVTVE